MFPVHNLFPRNLHFSARRLLGARIDGIVSLCFYLIGARARAVTQCIFEIGLRYLNGDRALYNDFKPNDAFCPKLNLCLTRISARTKEKTVFEFIRREFIEDDWVFDKSMSVFGYRPDAMLKMDTHAIIVEIDEHRHISYEPSAEFSRMEHMFHCLQTPVVFIRFNTDKYVNRYKHTCDPCWKINSSGDFVANDAREWNSRLQALKESILVHKRRVPPTWCKYYLFF